MGSIIGAVAGALGLGQALQPVTNAIGTAASIATNPMGAITQAVTGGGINY